MHGGDEGSQDENEKRQQDHDDEHHGNQVEPFPLGRPRIGLLVSSPAPWRQLCETRVDTGERRTLRSLEFRHWSVLHDNGNAGWAFQIQRMVLVRALDAERT